MRGDRKWKERLLFDYMWDVNTFWGSSGFNIEDDGFVRDSEVRWGPLHCWSFRTKIIFLYFSIS